MEVDAVPPVPKPARRHAHSSDKKQAYNWLKPEHRSLTYASYSQFNNRPATAFDFGDEGYAVSCNLGGELLQMSAPCEGKGLILARGGLETTLGSILARSHHISGGKSSFGLKLLPTSNRELASLRLGPMKERGCFNYRWPVNDYKILKHEVSDKDDDKEAGTCVLFSYVKEGVVYQVLRVEQGTSDSDIIQLFPNDCHVTLSILEPTGYEYLYERDIDGTDWSKWVRSPTPEHSRLEVKLYRLVEAHGRSDYQEIPLQSTTRDGIRAHETTFKLPERIQGGVKGRSMTFVAALRLGPTSSIDSSTSVTKPLMSHDLYNILGVDPLSEMATGAMWETIFLWKDQKMNRMSELNEVSLVARCIEKILHVDTLPAPFEDSSFPSPLAIANNVFLRAGLDMQSLFWKIRFLVKVLDFLETYRNVTAPNTTTQSGHLFDFLDDIKISRKIAQGLISRIKSYMTRLFSFLITTFIEPRNELAVMPLVKPFGPSDRSYYYVMITLWYVVKYRPECIPNVGEPAEFEVNLATWLTTDHSEDRGTLWDSNKLPSDNWLPENDLMTEVLILKWYHYGSVLNLLRWSWGKVLDEKRGGLMRKIIKIYNTVRRLVKAANIASAAMTSSKTPYIPGDEIIDRLSFLAEELDFDLDGALRYKMDALSIQRIRQSGYTMSLNPGKLPTGQVGNTDGPWEIHALCHHSRLKVSLLDPVDADTNKAEIESFRSKFCPFLTTEGSILSTWERKYSNRRHGWLRSETTCVVASTLLDICRGEFSSPTTGGVNELAQPATEPIDELAQSPTDSVNEEVKADGRIGTATRELQVTNQALDKVLSGVGSIEKLMGRTKFQQPLYETNHNTPSIDWTAFQPPHTYYPPEFLVSLDDTQELYTPNVTQGMRIPSKLRAYLAGGDKSRFEAPGWSKAEFENQSSLKDISVIDILSNDQKAPRVVGQLKEYVKAQEHNNKQLSRQEALEEWAKFRTSELCIASPELKNALSDSLVDQCVQHRLFFIKEPTAVEKSTEDKDEQQQERSTELTTPRGKLLVDRELVSTFAFVLHPEAVDGYTNQLLQISRFFCHGDGRWLARITLRGWTPAKNKGYEKFRGYDDRPETRNIRDDQIFLPKGLEMAFSRLNPDASVREKKAPMKVLLKVSSIIMSTNDFGDFSKCTIISDIFPPSAMKLLGDDLREMWQEFVHQPQTARCLAFLHILGALCDEITEGYDEAIDWFVNLLKLDGSFIRDENRWIKDRDSVAQLQLGLWSLESFHNLKNSLETAVKCVNEAKREMKAQIDKGSPQRSEPLQRLCQDYLEGFESKLVALEAVNIRLGRKIDLNSRYKDSMSAVLSLRDNRNSFKQNNTIQVLTYITILYLPVGLAATIFAIPDVQKVVRDAMGLRWFLGTIFIMLTFTITFAVLIARFQKPEWWGVTPLHNKFTQFKEGLGGKGSRSSENESPLPRYNR
ncbi:hypothetical protein HD806DRAFT_510372 [Xylariaceae sp. AK1471]|nr:hypothetical protein HD806DRAFT_510372 [Xylariaceae sp. AK1471]